jgi:hypothetical protein
MLRDRYPTVALFPLVPAMAREFEPVLAERDGRLAADGLVQAVKADLPRRRPGTATIGRPSTPVAVVLRMLVVRRLAGGSDAETEPVGGDRLVPRQFGRRGLERPPDETTRLRWARLLQTRHARRLARPRGRVGAPAQGEAGAQAAGGQHRGRAADAPPDRLQPAGGRGADAGAADPAGAAGGWRQRWRRWCR